MRYNILSTVPCHIVSTLKTLAVINNTCNVRMIRLANQS